MNANRETVLDWIRQGRIENRNFDAALRTAGVYPGVGEWTRFLRQLLLWSGAVMLAAAVIFFLAYNWKAMGRFAKFAVAEVPLVIAVALAVWRGVDSSVGRASLLAASLFTGGLLALVGQTYQTGADTFELFAVWGVSILPWACVARMPALWFMVLVLGNLAIRLYYSIQPQLADPLFASERSSWVLLFFNTAAWAAWETAALRLAWLKQRWAVRCLAFLSAGSVTVLANHAIFGAHKIPGLFAWIVWIALAYAVFRRRIYDLFVLACGVLSTVIVLSAGLIKILFSGQTTNYASYFLLVALAIIGLSGTGAWWLKQVSAEKRP